jgi:hypothetical protein
MLIRGSWFVCSDGTARPTIPIDVLDVQGARVNRRFLVDSGADSTVFSAALLADLGLPTMPAPGGVTFQGVGGTTAVVVVSTVLELLREDGGTANIRGQYAAFTNPQATDMSVLGRDILDLFDVVLSRRRNEVLLCNQNHVYVINGP